MKTKHTSGEWIIEQQIPYTVYALQIEKMGIDSISNEEAEANRLVMAAAPKLLDTVIFQAFLYPRTGCIELVQEATGQEWSRDDLADYVSEYLIGLIKKLDKGELK